MAAGSGSPPVSVRHAVRRLRGDLAVEIRTWLVICLVVGVAAGISGRYTWDEAPWIALIVGALAIPLLPVVWMSPYGRGRDLLFRPGGWRLFGMVVAWMVLSYVPTVFIIIALTRLGGID